MMTRELHWRVHGQDVTVRIDDSKKHGTFYGFGQSLPFRVLDANTIEISGKRHRFYVVRSRNECAVWLDGHTYYLESSGKTYLDGAAAITSSTGEITALMPGKVLRLEVALGDIVSEKQTVAIMESMKMETALRAPKAGRVTEIRCQPGQAVERGEVLVVISHHLEPDQQSSM